MTDPGAGPGPAGYAPLLDALDANRLDLLRRHDLTAIGVGEKVRGGRATGEACIKAFVARKLAPSALRPGALLPERLDTSLLTDVEETGVVTSPPPPPVPGARAADWTASWAGPWPEPWPAVTTGLAAPSVPGVLGRRRRPVTGGDAVSRVWGVAGTVATACTDLVDGRLALLTCNHVAAALGTGRPGDLILQPATVDGGLAVRDACGTLARYQPVWFTGATNRVDGAVIAVVPGLAAVGVHGLGRPVGVRPAGTLVPSEPVYKVGRTTGLTSGRVVAIAVSGWLAYPPPLGTGASAFFDDLVVTTAMAGFGDSGALTVDAGRRAVGLLFGGSSSHTFHNDITRVEQELAVRVLVGPSGDGSPPV